MPCSEIWKDIPEFGGAYQVSSYGRVRSIDRFVKASYGSEQFRQGKDITPHLTPNGYLAVSIRYNRKTYNFYLHRLVARAFVDNPHSYNEVNHIDEDKTNNHFNNLEWCSHLYNIRYGSTRAKISRARLAKGYGKIPIIQIKDGVEIARYDSATDASHITGIDASAIRKCCLGKPKFKTAGGYQWKLQ